MFHIIHTLITEILQHTQIYFTNATNIYYIYNFIHSYQSAIFIFLIQQSKGKEVSVPDQSGITCFENFCVTLVENSFFTANVFYRTSVRLLGNQTNSFCALQSRPLHLRRCLYPERRVTALDWLNALVPCRYFSQQPLSDPNLIHLLFCAFEHLGYFTVIFHRSFACHLLLEGH